MGIWEWIIKKKLKNMCLTNEIVVVCCSVIDLVFCLGYSFVCEEAKHKFFLLKILSK